MKRIIISAVFALPMFALGGCNSTAPTAETIDKIQLQATALCSFLPTYQTVQDIIVAGAYPPGIPVAQLADMVGKAICSSITVKSALMSGGEPTGTVNGVAIKGSYIGGK